MKLKYNFVSQEISDGYLAVAVGADVAQFGGMIKMNKVGNAIFNMLKEDVTMDEVVLKLMEKYEGDEEYIRSTAVEFIEILKSKGVIEE